jgi:hypothetical protein
MQGVAWLTLEGIPMGNGYFGGMPSSLFSGFYGTKLQKVSRLFQALTLQVQAMRRNGR